MVVVADCLSLQFCWEASDPSAAYTLRPTLFSGGHKQEPAFVQNILGKSSLTSAMDIHTLLTYLHPSDEHDFENDAVDCCSYSIDELSLVAEPFYDSEGSMYIPLDSYDEDESEHSYQPWQTPPLKRKATSRLPKRRPKASDESLAEKSPQEETIMNTPAKTSDGHDEITSGKFSFATCYG